MSRDVAPSNGCPHCIAVRSAEGSVEWWAAQLADATGEFVDADLLAMLRGRLIKITDPIDAPMRRRVAFARIAQHFAAKREVRRG